jgi:hypothetical protein
MCVKVFVEFSLSRYCDHPSNSKALCRSDAAGGGLAMGKVMGALPSQRPRRCGEVGGETRPRGGGNSADSLGAYHAVVYSNGTLTDIKTVTANLPVGFNLQTANAINLPGEIVGCGTGPVGDTRAFLLTPIATPEPASLALLTVDGLALLVRRRKTAG